ncbi:MAG: alpha/beta fold hydrolase, partial [Gammaproteobacteria bacterium]|nr:alpha/beta fold hydrolase [Gammaproteobacteria bacterium]
MSAVLYSEVKGVGKDVVLLHGWGMHGGLWGRFSELLAESCRCHVIDLPGYGYSRDNNNAFTLDSITKDIEDYINYINKGVIVVGWSLG